MIAIIGIHHKSYSYERISETMGFEYSTESLVDFFKLNFSFTSS